MVTVLFATGNDGKAKEVKNIYSKTKFDIKSLKDIGDYSDIVEDGLTLKENALIKARFIYEKYKVPVIADDTGLEVEQLDGAPGVYSARYAGENCSYDDNNNKLITELADKDEPHNAKFVCYAVYFDGENEIVVKGEFPGRIINEKAGEYGFGYDPIFVPDGEKTTLAEMSLEQKNKISHRAKAFNNLKEKMIQL
ncbi:MAG: RdgB/HAM1 family non-canonical purine NTP pyrophosphatase [Melioribacteraceae bacterium]|nr:RdgB/HAM1 family non-canonical purine NTP pyrophosphatase [Melioribacteraceae bacterium]